MSYTNNSLSLIPGTGISITPSTNTGSTQVTISATGTQILAVTIATTTPVTVTNSEDVISIEVPGSVPVAVNLPAGVTGRTFTIKDGLGLATILAPITITPAAGTIDGSATAIINVPYGSVTLVYSGTEWKII